jgi:hypothetical protein
VSAAEELFAAELSARLACYPPRREYKFDPRRGWKFDFCWPEYMLAVEIDGRGRHQSFTGFRDDCEKLNNALLLGWRVLRYPAACLAPRPAPRKPKRITKRSRPPLWPNGAADMIEEIRRALQERS